MFKYLNKTAVLFVRRYVRFILLRELQQYAEIAHNISYCQCQTCPANGEMLATCAAATKEDVDDAVKGA